MTNQDAHEHTHDADTTSKVEAVDPKKEIQSPSTGSRCAHCHHCNVPSHVGESSTTAQLKLKWHQTFFDREMEVLTNGRHRYFWQPKKGIQRLSLKQFARKDDLGKDWFEYKSGTLNEDRSDKNKARVQLEKSASKAARKKSKGGSSKATTTDVK